MPDIGGLPSAGSLAGGDGVTALEPMPGTSTEMEQVFEEALKGPQEEGEGKSKTTKRAVKKALNKMEAAKDNRLKAEVTANSQAAESKESAMPEGGARPLKSRSGEPRGFPAQERPGAQGLTAAAPVEQETEAAALSKPDRQPQARTTQPDRLPSTAAEPHGRAAGSAAPSSERHGDFSAAAGPSGQPSLRTDTDGRNAPPESQARSTRAADGDRTLEPRPRSAAPAEAGGRNAPPESQARAEPAADGERTLEPRLRSTAPAEAGSRNAPPESLTRATHDADRALEPRRPFAAPTEAGSPNAPHDAPAPAAPGRRPPTDAGATTGVDGQAAGAPQAHDPATARSTPQSPDLARTEPRQPVSPTRGATGPDDAELGLERPSEAADLSGFATLRTDAAQSTQPSQVNPASSPPPAELSEVVQEVANRILVSNPAEQPGGEVRIQLKESVLEGSDVRVFREHGELKIVVVARNEFAEQMVADHKGHLLRELGGRLPGEQIRLEVERPRDGQETGREANDGRSRQQYVRPDEQEPQ